MATTSIVQLTADLSASTATGAVSQLLPSGTVLPFAGRNVPAGWLLCDGSEVSKTTYSSLYASLLDATGTTGVYDTQVNPTTGSAYAAPAAGNFRIPDYRGLFLRGTGAPKGFNSDDSINSNATLDTVTLGVHQKERVKLPNSGFATQGAKNQFDRNQGGSGGHSHTVSGYGRRISFNTQSTEENFHIPGWSYYGSAGNFLGTESAGDHTHGWTSGIYFSTSVNSGGDAETRPVNKGINYIIKV